MGGAAARRPWANGCDEVLGDGLLRLAGAAKTGTTVGSTWCSMSPEEDGRGSAMGLRVIGFGRRCAPTRGRARREEAKHGGLRDAGKR